MCYLKINSTLNDVSKLVVKSRCGREVKAIDLKSISLWERRFEPYHLRWLLILLVTFQLLVIAL